jgi:hypothetical protein
MDMTNDRILAGLIRDLKELTDDYETQKRDYEKAIAERKHYLLAGDSASGKKEPPVRAGMYFGMDIGSAMQAYLTDRGGGPIKRKKIAIDLALAEAKMGDPSRHERHVKITANNNRGIFRYDEDTDTVALVSHSPPKRHERNTKIVEANRK